MWLECFGVFCLVYRLVLAYSCPIKGNTSRSYCLPSFVTYHQILGTGVPQDCSMTPKHSTESGAETKSKRNICKFICTNSCTITLQFSDYILSLETGSKIILPFYDAKVVGGQTCTWVEFKHKLSRRNGQYNIWGMFNFQRKMSKNGMCVCITLDELCITLVLDGQLLQPRREFELVHLINKKLFHMLHKWQHKATQSCKSLYRAEGLLLISDF